MTHIYVSPKAPSWLGEMIRSIDPDARELSKDEVAERLKEALTQDQKALAIFVEEFLGMGDEEYIEWKDGELMLTDGYGHFGSIPVIEIAGYRLVKTAEPPF